MMKLCVSSGVCGYTRDDPMEAFREGAETARAAGFEEFDLGLRSVHLLEDGWEKFYDTQCEIAAKAGIRMRYAHLPFDFPAKTAEGWERHQLAVFRGIEAAKRADVDCAVIHPVSWHMTEYDRDAEYAFCLEYLRPICECAHQAGLPLAIENMRSAGHSAPACLRRFATDVDDIIRLADELDEGICWDTGHANISMMEPEKYLPRIGRRLREIHVNDNHGEDDVHILPFQGQVKWDVTMRTLRKIGYQGSLNMELTAKKLPESARFHLIQTMADTGRELIRMFEAAE